jgi:anti-sigma-K factor RskA
MNHNEIMDLLGAYALDAVDDDERALIDEHLRACPRCRAEVAEHREVASLLAHGGGDAPEGVWQRIAESLEEAPPGLRLAPLPASPETSVRRRAPSRLAMAVLAAAAVVVAVLGVQVRQQDQRIDELQTALQDPLVPAFQAALEDRDSRVFALASSDGTIQLQAAMTDNGVGYLRATALPRLDQDRTYQLWGVAGAQIVSLGVLGADPHVVAFRAEPYERFAITEEDVPGVLTSGNPPVVAGRVA